LGLTRVDESGFCWGFCRFLRMELEGFRGAGGWDERDERDGADGGGVAGQEFLRADAEGANRPGPDSIVSMMAHRGGVVSQPERF